MFSYQFSFPSNSPIPLFLTLHSTDAQALDMVASAPNLCLLRTIAIGSAATKQSGTRRSKNTSVSSVSSAVFWPHDAGSPPPNGLRRGNASELAPSDGPGTRTLQGEISVPKGSKPTFTFPRFACSVSGFFFFFLVEVLTRAENNQVFHCVSAPRFGWFRPCECARGSPSDG